MDQTGGVQYSPGSAGAWFTLLLIAAFIPHFSSRAADEIPADYYERVQRACIEVLVDDHLDGSGWIADAEGFAVTAAHVVNTPGKRVEVMSPGIGRVEVKVIAIDRGNDTALLKLPKRDGGYPVLAFAAKIPPAPTSIFLLGSPIFRHGILLSGRIGRDRDTYEFMGFSGDYVRVMHLSGSGPPGSSGGPWLNANGEVIGLNSGLMRDGVASAGVGFMAPLDPIRTLVRTKKTPATPTLGAALEEMWEQKAEFIHRFPARTEGLVLRVVKKEGPAARAGLSDSDVLVEINDKKVRLRDEALDLLRALKSGDVIKVKLLQPAGGFSEKSVQLGDLESDWAATRNP